MCDVNGLSTARLKLSVIVEQATKCEMRVTERDAAIVIGIPLAQIHRWRPISQSFHHWQLCIQKTTSMLGPSYLLKFKSEKCKIDLTIRVIKGHLESTVCYFHLRQEVDLKFVAPYLHVTARACQLSSKITLLSKEGPLRIQSHLQFYETILLSNANIIIRHDGCIVAHLIEAETGMGELKWKENDKKCSKQSIARDITDGKTMFIDGKIVGLHGYLHLQIKYGDCHIGRHGEIGNTSIFDKDKVHITRRIMFSILNGNFVNYGTICSKETIELHIVHGSYLKWTEYDTAQNGHKALMNMTSVSPQFPNKIREVEGINKIEKSGSPCHWASSPEAEVGELAWLLQEGYDKNAVYQKESAKNHLFLNFELGKQEIISSKKEHEYVGDSPRSIKRSVQAKKIAIMDCHEWGNGEVEAPEIVCCVGMEDSEDFQDTNIHNCSQLKADNLYLNVNGDVEVGEEYIWTTGNIHAIIKGKFIVNSRAQVKCRAFKLFHAKLGFENNGIGILTEKGGQISCGPSSTFTNKSFLMVAENADLTIVAGKIKQDSNAKILAEDGFIGISIQDTVVLDWQGEICAKELAISCDKCVTSEAKIIAHKWGKLFFTGENASLNLKNSSIVCENGILEGHNTFGNPLNVSLKVGSTSSIFCQGFLFPSCSVLLEKESKLTVGPDADIDLHLHGLYTIDRSEIVLKKHLKPSKVIAKIWNHHGSLQLVASESVIDVGSMKNCGKVTGLKYATIKCQEKWINEAPIIAEYVLKMFGAGYIFNQREIVSGALVIMNMGGNIVNVNNGCLESKFGIIQTKSHIENGGIFNMLEMLEVEAKSIQNTNGRLKSKSIHLNLTSENNLHLDGLLFAEVEAIIEIQNANEFQFRCTNTSSIKYTTPNSILVVDCKKGDLHIDSEIFGPKVLVLACKIIKFNEGFEVDNLMLTFYGLIGLLVIQKRLIVNGQMTVNSKVDSDIKVYGDSDHNIIDKLICHESVISLTIALRIEIIFAHFQHFVLESEMKMHAVQCNSGNIAVDGMLKAENLNGISKISVNNSLEINGTVSCNYLQMSLGKNLCVTHTGKILFQAKLEVNSGNIFEDGCVKGLSASSFLKANAIYIRMQNVNCDTIQVDSEKNVLIDEFVGKTCSINTQGKAFIQNSNILYQLHVTQQNICDNETVIASTYAQFIHTNVSNIRVQKVECEHLDINAEHNVLVLKTTVMASPNTESATPASMESVGSGSIIVKSIKGDVFIGDDSKISADLKVVQGIEQESHVKDQKDLCTWIEDVTVEKTVDILGINVKIVKVTCEATTLNAENYIFVENSMIGMGSMSSAAKNVFIENSEFSDDLCINKLDAPNGLYSYEFDRSEVAIINSTFRSNIIANGQNMRMEGIDCIKAYLTVDKDIYISNGPHKLVSKMNVGNIQSKHGSVSIQNTNFKTMVFIEQNSSNSKSEIAILDAQAESMVARGTNVRAERVKYDQLNITSMNRVFVTEADVITVNEMRMSQNGMFQNTIGSSLIQLKGNSIETDHANGERLEINAQNCIKLTKLTMGTVTVNTVKGNVFVNESTVAQDLNVVQDQDHNKAKTLTIRNTTVGGTMDLLGVNLFLDMVLKCETAFLNGEDIVCVENSTIGTGFFSSKIEAVSVINSTIKSDLCINDKEQNSQKLKSDTEVALINNKIHSNLIATGKNIRMEGITCKMAYIHTEKNVIICGKSEINTGYVMSVNGNIFVRSSNFENNLFIETVNLNGSLEVAVIDVIVMQSLVIKGMNIMCENVKCNMVNVAANNNVLLERVGFGNGKITSAIGFVSLKHAQVKGELTVEGTSHVAISSTYENEDNPIPTLHVKGRHIELFGLILVNALIAAEAQIIISNTKMDTGYISFLVGTAIISETEIANEITITKHSNNKDVSNEDLKSTITFINSKGGSVIAEAPNVALNGVQSDKTVIAAKKNVSVKSSELHQASICTRDGLVSVSKSIIKDSLIIWKNTEEGETNEGSSSIELDIKKSDLQTVSARRIENMKMTYTKANEISLIAVNTVTAIQTEMDRIYILSMAGYITIEDTNIWNNLQVIEANYAASNGNRQINLTNCYIQDFIYAEGLNTSLQQIRSKILYLSGGNVSLDKSQFDTGNIIEGGSIAVKNSCVKNVLNVRQRTLKNSEGSNTSIDIIDSNVGSILNLQANRVKIAGIKSSGSYINAKKIDLIKKTRVPYSETGLKPKIINLTAKKGLASRMEYNDNEFNTECLTYDWLREVSYGSHSNGTLQPHLIDIGVWVYYLYDTFTDFCTKNKCMDRIKILQKHNYELLEKFFNKEFEHATFFPDSISINTHHVHTQCEEVNDELNLYSYNFDAERMVWFGSPYEVLEKTFRMYYWILSLSFNNGVLHQSPEETNYHKTKVGQYKSLHQDPADMIVSDSLNDFRPILQEISYAPESGIEGYGTEFESLKLIIQSHQNLSMGGKRNAVTALVFHKWYFNVYISDYGAANNQNGSLLNTIAEQNSTEDNAVDVLCEKTMYDTCTIVFFVHFTQIPYPVLFFSQFGVSCKSTGGKRKQTSTASRYDDLKLHILQITGSCISPNKEESLNQDYNHKNGKFIDKTDTAVRINKRVSERKNTISRLYLSKHHHRVLLGKSSQKTCFPVQ